MAEVLASGPSRITVAETFYASVREMAEWMAVAPSGEEIIFARGTKIDSREAAAVLAEKWRRRGLVHFGQRQRPRRAGLEFYVRKLAVLPAANGAQQAERLREHREREQLAWQESEEGRVYWELCRCANLAQPCPSNQAVSDRLNLTDRNRAQYLIRQLCERGLIRLEAAAKLGPRVVRIVATGKCTPENGDNLRAKR